MSEQRFHVLIVDDQRLMREGLRIILEDAPDIEVVGEAGNGTQGDTDTRRSCDPT